MVRNKTLVLVCAVLAVGLFVLPSALSLFANQHTFDEGAVARTKCSKCHTLEADEIIGGTAHRSTFFGTTPDEACLECHQYGHPTGQGTDYHAAISVECQVCHPITISGDGRGTMGLDSPIEAHRDFYYAALGENSTLQQGANEACIGCHTHVNVNITWERATMLAFTAGHTIDGWNVTDFAAE